ncbi:MAG: hypothetical protein IJ246_02605 [Clostridia bacterium]|nr:hypothetical protein [Clostridia bacterium]
MRRTFCLLTVLGLLLSCFPVQGASLPVPESLSPADLLPCDAGEGKTEILPYATDYGEKEALVYLPPAYDPEGAYPVFYWMHGGGETPYSFLNPARSMPLSNLLDHRITQGDVPPLILVCPTYDVPVNNPHYGAGVDTLTEQFPEELTRFLIPAVDASYATIPDRLHRAFGGFSMGAVTAWYVFLQSLDAVSVFVPVSSDCWALGRRNGGCEEMADLLSDAAADEVPFRIYALTGAHDFAMDPMRDQIENMEKREVFRHTLFFGLFPEGRHDRESAYTELDAVLSLLFPYS